MCSRLSRPPWLLLWRSFCFLLKDIDIYPSDRPSFGPLVTDCPIQKELGMPFQASSLLNILFSTDSHVSRSKGSLSGGSTHLFFTSPTIHRSYGSVLAHGFRWESAALHLDKLQVESILKAKDSWGRTVVAHAVLSERSQVFDVIFDTLREQIRDVEVLALTR